MTNKTVFEIEVRHKGLNKYRHIKGTDSHVVKQKAAAQELTWDEMWQKKLLQDQKRAEKELSVVSKAKNKKIALERTEDAEKDISALGNILSHSISTKNTVNWNHLTWDTNFTKDKPTAPVYRAINRQPVHSDEKYTSKPNFFELLIPRLKRKKANKINDLFSSDREIWKKKKKDTDEYNLQIDNIYAYNLREWSKEKEAYVFDAQESNNKLSKLKNDYRKGCPDALVEFCNLVLSNSNYPDCFNPSWQLDYLDASKILVADYALPDIDDLPRLKNVNYIISKDEFVNKYLSDAALKNIYDSLLYQISLRTIHELFEADVMNTIDTIVFNGWVDSIDKATGLNSSSCIMSCQASKDEFLAFKLSKVDPKSCFRMLKGVGSSRLHSLTPVAPLIRIDKEDSRFVDGYEVVDGLNESDNLAAMDWQDFENLIRELFEKEFSVNGGEVKITRGIRDGGVDAIAFDPDPIRGGKIVIQAKRYTNIVDVSSVRDLYGTILNEGATKGVLVTTAHFGGDAYEFAKGKPITLLDGGNLLSLLDKHGHKAIIDIKAAKKILRS